MRKAHAVGRRTQRQAEDADGALRTAVETCPGDVPARTYALTQLKRLKP